MNLSNLTTHTGIEISGLDCSRALSENLVSKIKDIIQEKHFICFKNQNLNEEKLSKFAKNFGSLEIYPEKDKTKRSKEIFNVSNVSALN